METNPPWPKVWRWPDGVIEAIPSMSLNTLLGIAEYLCRRVPDFQAIAAADWQQKGMEETTIRRRIQTDPIGMLESMDPHWEAVSQALEKHGQPVPVLEQASEPRSLDEIKDLVVALQGLPNAAAGADLASILKRRAWVYAHTGVVLPWSWIDLMRHVDGVQAGGLHIFGTKSDEWKNVLTLAPDHIVFGRSGQGLLHLYDIQGCRIVSPDYDGQSSGRVLFHEHDFVSYLSALLPRMLAARVRVAEKS